MGIGTVMLGILLLGIVIFVHELGHFLAAKWRRVTVLKFSLGMGPEIIGFTRGGTRYCLSWIPLGGFVQMAGDHLEEDGSMPAGGPEQFLTHPWYGRVVIAVAGPAANLVTAVFVILLASLVGVQQPDWPNQLGPLADTTAAYHEGLRAGDTFIRLDGRTLKSWRELDHVARGLGSKPEVVFELTRGPELIHVQLPAQRMKLLLAGLRPPPPPPVIGGVSPGMPAYRAGLQEGDSILSVGGVTVESFEGISRAVRGKADQPLVFRLSRAGRQFDLKITPMVTDRKSGSAMIGISAPRGMTYVEGNSLGESLRLVTPMTVEMVKQVYASMWMTVLRPLYYRDAVGGPLFIVEMAGESARRGAGDWMFFLAFINIAVMAFNLLPIPLLDGGHITLALLEALRRRSVSGRTYMNFQKVGLVLVGTLFVFILSKDLMRPLQRLRAIDQAPRESVTVEPSHR